MEDEERVGVDADDLHAVDAAPEQRVRDVGDDARRVLDLERPSERERAETPLDVEQQLRRDLREERGEERLVAQDGGRPRPDQELEDAAAGRRGEGLAAHREEPVEDVEGVADPHERDARVDLQPTAAHELLRRVARLRVRGHVALVASQRDRHRLLVGEPGLELDLPGDRGEVEDVLAKPLPQARVVVDVASGCDRRWSCPGFREGFTGPPGGPACPSTDEPGSPSSDGRGCDSVGTAFGRGRRRRR